MEYKEVTAVRDVLVERLATLEDKATILRASELRGLFAGIRDQPSEQRAAYGQAVNAVKVELEELVSQSADTEKALRPIDITAPFDVNAQLPSLLPSTQGTVHPFMNEINVITDIFYRMGFEVAESREIDDQYHMFETLNFPKGHPARDDWDTFMTIEKDKDGDAFIAPAHTSTMQNRLLTQHKKDLENGRPIAVVVPDRVFRNEDLDARHEHTFYQIEGIYVSKNIHTGMIIATLKSFLEAYYGKVLDIRTNPFYFPFTEPSLEISLSCPFCEKQGCNICSYSGWIELLGCGMIHPHVLTAAGIDPTIYTGFAWGLGLDRLVMMKYDIEDVRHFESAKLDFLRQFS